MKKCRKKDPKPFKNPEGPLIRKYPDEDRGPILDGKKPDKGF